MSPGRGAGDGGGDVGGGGVETRRILVFLAFAFAIAWAVGAYIYATGGLAGSPPLVSGVPLSRATVLLATGYR
jgi:hypothetical protein